MIFEKIKKIFSEKLSISKENIMLSTRMKEDLGLDSFDAVELIIELENIFNLKIEDEKIQQCKNIKDIVEYIEIKIQEKKNKIKKLNKKFQIFLLNIKRKDL